MWWSPWLSGGTDGDGVAGSAPDVTLWSPNHASQGPKSTGKGEAQKGRLTTVLDEALHAYPGRLEVEVEKLDVTFPSER